MTREELLRSREYWITKIQVELFHELEEYMKHNNVSRTQLAEQLGVTKGYISQILNGDFDHRISKLVDLSLAIGKVPNITYSDLPAYLAKEAQETRSGGISLKSGFKKVVHGDQFYTLPIAYDAADVDNVA